MMYPPQEIKIYLTNKDLLLPYQALIRETYFNISADTLPALS